MNTLYLKASSEQALIEALPFARGVSQVGESYWISATHEYALDIVGDLYNNDSILNGVIIVTPATKISGFHANITCNDRIMALIPVEIIIMPPPGRIQRMWA